MLDGLMEKLADAPQFAQLKQQVAQLVQSVQRTEFNMAVLAELERRRDGKAYAEAAQAIIARFSPPKVNP